MLKLKIIACDVLNREISYLASQSKNYVDVTFLNQGLHNTPDKLKEIVQTEVNKANGEFPYNYYNTSPKYDYIILGYGLCSNGIVGITSHSIPMIIPRAHDCITMLMGSKESYKSSFQNYPGTFWFSSGWIERGWQPSELKYTALLKDYTQKYGEDNAKFLMEIEQNSMKEYKKAGFISWDCFQNNEYYRKVTKDSSKFFDWDFVEIEGSRSLLENIINGEFHDNEVLVVPPMSVVNASHDDEIIKNDL
ncbi:MAG: DUF1638 domain-containing protein [Ruminiclostridium sp.]